jgi:hypothetical protein
LVCLVLAGTGSLSACGESGPPPDLKIHSVTDLGPMSEHSFIRGRDGGYSGLAFGRSVWVYGDTILGTADSEGSTWHNNSFQWTEDLDASDGLAAFGTNEDAAGAPKEFLPQTVEEHAYNDAHRGDPCKETPCGARWALWPGALIWDAERSRAIAFYSKLHAEPGDFNFYGVGSSLAVWYRFEDPPARPQLRPGADDPTLLFGPDEPGFGSAALVVEQWLYAYACQLDGFSKPCRLARAPLDRVTERSAWEFFTGGGEWSGEVARAEPVFEGNDILSIAYNSHLERYLAVYDQPMDHRVMLRTAPAPEGPWSAPLEAFIAQTPEGDPDGWIYDGQAHPEIEQDSGRIQYISYSRGTGFLQSEVRLVRIDLE